MYQLLHREWLNWREISRVLSRVLGVVSVKETEICSLPCWINPGSADHRTMNYPGLRFSGQLILLVGLIWATATFCCEVGEFITDFFRGHGYPWVPTCRSDWFQVIFLDLWCSGYLAKIPKINGGFMRFLVSSWENHLFLWAMVSMVSMVSMAMLVIARWYDDLWWLRTSWKPRASTERARQWLSLQRHDHCWGACSEPLRHTLRLGIQRTTTWKPWKRCTKF